MYGLNYFCSPMKVPPISEVRSIDIPDVKEVRLSNGLQVFTLHDPSAEYLRFDLVLDAGRHQERVPLTSKAAALLMKEGTETMTRKEISDHFESKGSSLTIRTTLDHTFLSFISLSDHAIGLMETIVEILSSPSYSSVEIQKFAKRQSRKLDIELRKTEVVAYRQMTSEIYGDDTPYGYNSTRKLYNELSKEAIEDYYNQVIRSCHKWIFLAGKVDDAFIHRLEQLFVSLPDTEPQIITTANTEFIPRSRTHLDMPSSVQTSIRLFRPLFNRQHEDYAEMFFLSIILGGYFGSRLMKNIREDKGLTYGIYASLDTLQRSGYLYISTETKHDNAEKVEDLIRHEMDVLLHTICPAEELLMVKRYMAGQFLRMIDGPLNVIKVSRTLALDGLSKYFYNELLDRIWRCSPQTLQATAQSYLRPDQFSLVTVGKQMNTPS